MNKVAYDQKYIKENIKRYSLNLSKIYDLEIIERLESVQNKSAYIKALILADIASEKVGESH